jgi:hypothetical protein
MAFIFIIIALIIIINLRKSQQQARRMKFYNTLNYPPAANNNLDNKNTSSIKVTVESTSKTIYMDDSIIDVGSKSYKITDYGVGSKVPYWAHSYVYSYYELKYATKEQKAFYSYFKDNFINGVNLDVEGNTNYAFILLFDLLNEFDSHKDISKLESQILQLGEHYEKTKSYGINFLIQKMKDVGDYDGIEKLTEDHYHYGIQVNYSTFEWRNKFKKKLGLNKSETKLLDKIWYSSNTFVSIDFCCVEVIKLYLAVIPKLENFYLENGTTLAGVFDEVIDIVVRKHYRHRKGSMNYKYAIDSTEHEFYTNIFKCCENTVRDSYANKRKITVDPYANTPEVKAEFESRIINEVAAILSGLTSSITPPDEATEIKLNQLNTTRWRITFDAITSSYTSNKNGFEEQIVTLGDLNKENPSVENIFFEASKFIAKYDKPMALSLYIHYIYHDLKSATFDNKQLTKSIQKSLFTNEEQFNIFQGVINKFIKDKDFEKALLSIPQVYAVKRKKIQLDSSSIKEVQELHSGTVALLNEYLKDENEQTEEILMAQNTSQEEIEISVVQENDEETISIYSKEFAFTEIHTSALEVFMKNNYSLLQIEFEHFAKSKGVFKNQLIDTINEICYDRLDDLLIEEDEDYYTINQNYYHKLLAS